MVKTLYLTDIVIIVGFGRGLSIFIVFACLTLKGFKAFKRIQYL